MRERETGITAIERGELLLSGFDLTMQDIHRDTGPVQVSRRTMKFQNRHHWSLSCTRWLPCFERPENALAM